MAILQQKEAQSLDCVLLLFQMTSRVLYSAQYNRQHCTPQAFEQFGALYMHNHDDKYLARLLNVILPTYVFVSAFIKFETSVIISCWAAMTLAPVPDKKQHILILSSLTETLKRDSM